MGQTSDDIVVTYNKYSTSKLIQVFFLLPEMSENFLLTRSINKVWAYGVASHPVRGHFRCYGLKIEEENLIFNTDILVDCFQVQVYIHAFVFHLSLRSPEF